MPRIYTASFEGVLVAAAQDLFQITGAAEKIVRVRRAVVSSTDTTIPTAQMLQFRARFLPSAVTPGTGGTAPVPQRVDLGDAAASLTALANNTVKATTTGTPAVLYEGGCHVYNGLDESFDPDGRGLAAPVIGPSEAWVLELLSAPAGTLHLSGTLWVEESGG